MWCWVSTLREQAPILDSLTTQTCRSQRYTTPNLTKFQTHLVSRSYAAVLFGSNVLAADWSVLPGPKTVILCLVCKDANKNPLSFSSRQKAIMHSKRPAHHMAITTSTLRHPQGASSVPQPISSRAAGKLPARDSPNFTTQNPFTSLLASCQNSHISTGASSGRQHPLSHHSNLAHFPPGNHELDALAFNDDTEAAQGNSSEAPPISRLWNDSMRGPPLAGSFGSARIHLQLLERIQRGEGLFSSVLQPHGMDELPAEVDGMGVDGGLFDAEALDFGGT